MADRLLPVTLAALAVLAALNLLLLVWLLLRGDGRRSVDELRREVQDSARGTRQELAQTLMLFQQTLLAQQGGVARTQNEQIEAMRATVEQRLAAIQADNEKKL
jgi:DNA recombination protein RmuC